MIQRIFQTKLVIYTIYTLSYGQPAHFYNKPEINPTLEAYNLRHPRFPNITVEIYYQGFAIIIRDDIESYVTMDLHGNLNIVNDDNYEAQYYDVCEPEAVDTKTYWFYRNHEVKLKHGDYFYFWAHVVEPSGRTLRVPPGHFYVRKKIPDVLF